MKRTMFIACIGATMSLLSCSKERISGNGPIVTETRTVAAFSKVEIEGSTSVYISQGSPFRVDVKGYSNLLPYFESVVQAGTLSLGYRNNVNVKNDNTEVYITMPALEGLKLEGSGKINTTGTFGGNVDFETIIRGSGEINIAAGNTVQFRSTIEGSGNLYAFGMHCQKAETNTTGSGNTELTVANELKVRIVGSGNVYYKNTPVITAQITGSGEVIPR